MDYLDYHPYLEALYQGLRRRRTSYSYVEFAEDLGFSKTNVIHLIIRGKRPLTVKSADRIASAIALKGHARRFFFLLVRYQNSRQAAEREILFQQILDLKGQSLHSKTSKAQLDFFSEWYHVVIYELTFSPRFRSDPKWIAAHIFPTIRVDEARKSLALLESLQLIRYEDSLNRHIPTRRQITTGDDIASVAVTRYHHKMIDLGKRSLTEVRDQQRDITSIAIAIPDDCVPQLKAAISRFRKEILALVDPKAEESNIVYQMNLQLFPVTRKLEDKDDK
jgi:uncharacterized protein (TIGR02147 family)